MAYLSGFQQRTKIINLSLSCNCFSTGQQLQHDKIQIRFCLFGLITFSTVFYTKQFNPPSNRPLSISTLMKPGSIRTPYGCQSQRSRELHENQLRPFCIWVVGNPYHPPCDIKSNRLPSMITSSPLHVIQHTSRPKTSFCREHWLHGRLVPRILCRNLLPRCDVTKPLGSDHHEHRDTMLGKGWGSMYHQCRLGVGLRYCDTYHILKRTVLSPEKDCVYRQ
jgi:hypothetical protein